LTPFTVDTQFFAPARADDGGGDGDDPRPAMIATAGLERRDYPTLIEAARGLDVRVVVAAASPWSRRRDSTAGVDLPSNVEVRSLPFAPLRRLYADARFVVMPLDDVEFQAGVTTILEAMAMGKAVVCSRTRGQTDVIVDGETGVYVPPGDSEALRAAIERLLADPEQADALGREGRRYVEQECDVEVYARRLGALVARTASSRRRVVDQPV
jgi:glycosyltransferase involved in cell wall biosynthesis